MRPGPIACYRAVLLLAGAAALVLCSGCDSPDPVQAGQDDNFFEEKRQIVEQAHFYDFMHVNIRELVCQYKCQNCHAPAMLSYAFVPAV